MASGFVQGIASALVPEIQAITKERRERKAKEREPSYQFRNQIFQAIQNATSRPGTPEGDQGAAFIEQLRKSGLGGIGAEGGVTLHSQQPDFATQMAQILTMNQGGGMNQGQQGVPPTEPVAPQAIQPQRGTGVESFPIVNKAIGIGRDLGRGLGFRETQAGLTKSYSAKTASAAKALEDSGNIAVAERKMLEQSFPLDADTLEARSVKRQSMESFFDAKEQVLQEEASKPVQQIVSGTSRQGIRTTLDPAAIANKKKAQEGLLKLKQARVMFQQMFDEADQSMPAIGQPSGAGKSRTSNGIGYTVEQ